MTALGLIPSWAWRWIALGLVMVSAAGFGWVKGNEHGTQKLTAYIGEQAAETVRLRSAKEKIVTLTETKWRTKIEKVIVQATQNEKEAKDHVTTKDDAGCTVTDGFVRVYDAAWQGQLAGPPAESDRGPSGIPLSQVAETDAHNAGACLAYKAQRDGLIEMYRKLQAVK